MPDNCNVVEAAAEPTVAAPALTQYGEAVQAARAALTAIPEAMPSPTPQSSAILVIANEETIIYAGNIIGRQGDIMPAVVCDDISISRRHVRMDQGQNSWFLTNIAASGSPVNVNGRPLLYNDRLELPPGTHRLALGDRFSAEIRIT